MKKAARQIRSGGKNRSSTPRTGPTNPGILGRRRAAISVLQEITAVVAASLDIEDAYPRLTAQLQRLIPFDRMLVSTLDLERKELTPRYVAGSNIDQKPIGVPAPLSGTAAEMALSARRGIIDGQADQGLRSLMIVPLYWRGAAVGIMAFHSTREDAYGPADLELAERIGGQIAGALANSILHERVKDTAHHQAVLAEIGRIVASSLDIEEILPTLAAATAQLIPFDRIVVNTIDRESATLTYTHLYGTDSVPRRSLPRPLAGTVTAHIARARAGLIIPTEEIEGSSCPFETLRRDLRLGLRSALAVPLVSRNAVVGALIFQSSRRDAYTERDLAIGVQIASQIGGAIANATLHAELQKAAREYELLAELARGAAVSRDLGGFFHRVGGVIAQLISFDRLSVRFLDPFIPGVSVDAPAASAPAVPTPSGTADLERPFHTNGSVSAKHELPAADVGRREGTPPGISARAAASYVQVPLRSELRLLGEIELVRSTQQPFSHWERTALERASGHIGSAVETILAFEKADADADVLALVTELARVAAEARSLAAACRRFAERLRGLVPFDLLVVAGFDHERRALRVLWSSANVTAADRASAEVPVSGTVAELVSATGRACLIGGPAGHDPVPELPKWAATFRHENLACGVAAPVVSAGQSVGTLYLLAADPSRFNQRLIQIAESTAALLGRFFPSPDRESEALTRFGRLDSRSPVAADAQTPPFAGITAAVARRDPGLLGRPAGMYIVDENSLCRQGMRSLLSDSPLQVLDEFQDLAGAIPRVSERKPDVVMWEIHAHSPGILEDVRRFKRDCPDGKLLLIDNEGSAEFLKEVIAAGASSYLLKGVSPAALVEAGLSVASGGSCVDSKLLARFLESLPVASVGPTRREAELLTRLSDADIEILKAVALGRSNDEIARTMMFATGTIKNRLGRIYRKIGVIDRSAATSFAIRAGLVR